MRQRRTCVFWHLTVAAVFGLLLAYCHGSDANTNGAEKIALEGLGCDSANDRENSQPAELLFLTYNPKYFNSTGYWKDRLEVRVNPIYNSTFLCYRYTGNSNFTVYKIENSSIEIHAHSVQLEVVAKQHQKKYHQTLSFVRPISKDCPSSDRLDCQWHRFVYSDQTSCKGYDILHIDEDLFQDEDRYEYTIHRVLKYDAKPSGILAIINSPRKWKETLTSVNSSHYYVLLRIPSVVKTEDYVVTYCSIAMAIIIIIVILVGVFVVIYISKPKKKIVGFINCRCEAHRPFNSVIDILKSFLEANCLIEVKDVADIFFSSKQKRISKDDENERFIKTPIPLISETTELDYVIHVPFPHVINHEPSDDIEIEELKLKCIGISQKAEIEMPWITEKTKCLWASSECEKFVLMQEFYLLVRFFHPCYYPDCLERWFRKDLHKSAIESSLHSKSITNSFIMEVTRVLPTIPHSRVIAPEVVNINIDEFCC